MSDENEPLLTPRERTFLEKNPDAAIVDAEVAARESDRPRDLKGVEGWLLLLAVGLTFLGPLLNFVLTQGELQISNAGHPPTPTSQFETELIWAFFVFYATLSVFAGYRLFRCHRPSTVPIVIACMWLPVLVSLALVLIGDGATAAGIAVAKSILTSSAWTAYLLRSKRVKNTYGIGRTP